MKSLIIGCLGLLTMSYTCGDTNINENALGEEVEAMVGEQVKTAESLNGKLDELPTMKMAANISGLNEVEGKKDYTKWGSFESLKYEWKSEREKSLEVSKDNFMKCKVENVIELSWVRNMTLAEFKQNYHNPTKEEIANAKKAMGNKMDELNKVGKASEEQGSQALNIAESSISKFSVTEAPGVGDYSVFVNSGIMGAKTRDLKVFYRGLSFSLNVDLSDDAKYNDAKAIQLAKKIITEKLK